VPAALTVVLATLTTCAAAYLAHLASLAHVNLLAAVPVGAALIGATAALGVVAAIRLTHSHDTAGFRIFAQGGGMTAYVGAVLLDYLAHRARVAPGAGATDLLAVLDYMRLLVSQAAAAISAQMPPQVPLPAPAALWLGMVRLLVEILAAAVSTGWTISYLAGVPFCWKNRRFYELRYLVESADQAAVREWEVAIHQRRPLEARALLARARAGRVRRSDPTWMRIVVHQCPICLAARVRIERCRRIPLGGAVVESAQEMGFDAARGAALLAT
jgi:hypothetical protein